MLINLFEKNTTISKVGTKPIVEEHLMCSPHLQIINACICCYIAC